MKIISLIPAPFAVTLFLLISCKGSQTSCCDEKSDPSYGLDSLTLPKEAFAITDVSQIKDAIDSTGIYLNTTFQFLIKNDSPYIAYFSRPKDKLVLVNLLKKESSIRIPLTGILPPRNKYCINLINDTLHVVSLDSHIYYQLYIDNSFALTVLNSIRLNDFINFEDLYLNSNIIVSEKIWYQHPYLCLPFGNYKKKNEIDKKSTLSIDIVKKTAAKVLGYPEKYRNCDVRQAYPILGSTGDDRLLAVFLKNNSIEEFEPGTGKQTSHVFNFPSDYMCYDAALQENLAYTSKFDVNDEQNFNLIVSNDHIFVIKRLRKKPASSPYNSAILVFNRRLENISVLCPAFNIHPAVGFFYKDQLCLFNDSLNKMFALPVTSPDLKTYPSQIFNH